MDDIFLPIYLFLCPHITITGNCSDHEQESLAQEIELGKSLGGDKHPNIVNFLACVCTCSKCLSSEFSKYHVESYFILEDQTLFVGWREGVENLGEGGGAGESGERGWRIGGGGEHDVHFSSIEYKGRTAEY